MLDVQSVWTPGLVAMTVRTVALTSRCWSVTGDLALSNRLHNVRFDRNCSIVRLVLGRADCA